MSKFNRQRTINMGLRVGMCLFLGAGAAAAQQAPTRPTDADLYCAGVATTEAVPADSYVISGENSGYRITFMQGDRVFINRGSDMGVKVGDEFEVVRPVHTPPTIKWFEAQPQLIRAMGTMYNDIGRLKVESVQSKTSTATVTMFCDIVLRGDIVRPFAARPAPQFHSSKLDPDVPPTGKTMAMVVTTKGYGQVAGRGTTVYVNLGSEQGVKVGDYFRVFRYQGNIRESASQTPGMAYKVTGMGAAPMPYHWDELPRQILGEGIVLRTGPSSASVLVTAASQEIYDGDYVEIE